MFTGDLIAGMGKYWMSIAIKMQLNQQTSVAITGTEVGL